MQVKKKPCGEYIVIIHLISWIHCRGSETLTMPDWIFYQHSDIHASPLSKNMLHVQVHSVCSCPCCMSMSMLYICTCPCCISTCIAICSDIYMHSIYDYVCIYIYKYVCAYIYVHCTYTYMYMYIYMSECRTVWHPASLVPDGKN
jgi:hypothetical protein